MYRKYIELVRVIPKVDSGFHKKFSNKKEETIISSKYIFFSMLRGIL